MRGPALRTVLIRIATKVVTPTQGLIELNKSDYAKSRAPLKMDKFRDIAVDPFYAGMVVIDKQVKVRNENGLHEPLITKAQHLELVRIMDDKKKTQSGPRKNGNPKYPLSNLVSCSLCTDKTNGRYVGYDHGNGKNKALVYEKYRCRACKRYLTRQQLHSKIKYFIKQTSLNPKTVNALMMELKYVWKQNEGQAEQEAVRISHKIAILQEAIRNHVEAVTDPSRASIHAEILDSISAKKKEVAELESRLEAITGNAEADKEQFLKFALEFADNMSSNFFGLSKENRLKCKQLIFPDGFYLDSKNKVYTPRISPLYSLAVKKKDTEVSKNSRMVRVTGL